MKAAKILSVVLSGITIVTLGALLRQESKERARLERERTRLNRELQVALDSATRLSETNSACLKTLRLSRDAVESGDKRLDIAYNRMADLQSECFGRHGRRLHR